MLNPREGSRSSVVQVWRVGTQSGRGTSALAGCVDAIEKNAQAVMHMHTTVTSVHTPVKRVLPSQSKECSRHQTLFRVPSAHRFRVCRLQVRETCAEGRGASAEHIQVCVPMTEEFVQNVVKFTLLRRQSRVFTRLTGADRLTVHWLKRFLGGGTHDNKMSKGHLPRAVYHQANNVY